MEEERSQGSAEEHEWMDDDLGEESDPATTCDEDVADLSDTFESASDSYDSDADYFEPRTSEPAEDEPTALLLSKDKTIQCFPMDLASHFQAAPVDTFEAKQGKVKQYSSVAQLHMCFFRQIVTACCCCC